MASNRASHVRPSGGSGPRRAHMGGVDPGPSRTPAGRDRSSRPLLRADSRGPLTGCVAIAGWCGSERARTPGTGERSAPRPPAASARSMSSRDAPRPEGASPVQETARAGSRTGCRGRRPRRARECVASHARARGEIELHPVARSTLLALTGGHDVVSGQTGVATPDRPVLVANVRRPHPRKGSEVIGSPPERNDVHLAPARKRLPQTALGAVVVVGGKHRIDGPPHEAGHHLTANRPWK